MRLQNRAARWHAARFPACTPEDIGLKAMSELGEVADAVLAEGRDAAHPERAGNVAAEAADVVICLLALCGRFTAGDLLNAVDAKLRILETPGGAHPGCLPRPYEAKMGEGGS
jgi:NTP pyrophosphatase (non-canonical NTP hydrolase)